MKRLLYFGPTWEGSTSLQRAKAFSEIGMDVKTVSNGSRIGPLPSLLSRVLWKVRLPLDVNNENERLVCECESFSPDYVVVDNSKVIRKSTIAKLHHLGVNRVAYYTPDDICGTHNLSLYLKWSLTSWDIIFVTKTFNIPELKALGVARPVLVGKSFEKNLHRSLSRDEVGAEFESFDVVFIGTFEKDRWELLNRLADTGIKIALFGGDKGGWSGKKLSSNITLFPSVFGMDYVRAWHWGKVALCFLRKLNRDKITQRTMEIAAIGRPMLAEKTDEHDLHFIDGFEYFGFQGAEELIQKVSFLLASPAVRADLGERASLRCRVSGYSTYDRALFMERCLASEELS